MDLEKSSWAKFPTEEDPHARYKYTSVVINASADQRQISRKTYSLLDWIGDIGGFFDGLNAILGFFLRPLAVYALNTKLTSLIVHFKNKEVEAQKQDDSELSGLRWQQSLAKKVTADLSKR